MVKSVRVISGLALALSVARGADAQSTSRTPPLFQGLFGPTEADQLRPRLLNVTWALYDAIDDNSAFATDTDILDQTLQARRPYTGGAVNLLYTRRPPHSLLTLNASLAGRYYPDLHQAVTSRFGGGMSIDHYPAPDWRVQFSSDVSSSPYYQLVLAPHVPALSAPDPAVPQSLTSLTAPDTPAPTMDDAVSSQHTIQYGSFVGVTHAYSERSSLALSYDLHYTQFLSAFDSTSQRGAALFTRSMTKNVGLRLGYAYGVTAGADPSAVPFHNSDIDIGLSYGRSLSPSSRTSFGFSTGSTILSASDGQHFMLTGSGQLSRRLSPMWTARLLYDRGLQVPEGTTQPLFSDSLAASVTGYFSRRVSLSVQPSYAHGFVGTSGEANAFNSFTNSTRLDVALGHRLAFYVEHFLYQFHFANSVGLPAILTTGLNRQGARVGLSMWTPFVP